MTPTPSHADALAHRTRTPRAHARAHSRNARTNTPDRRALQVEIDGAKGLVTLVSGDGTVQVCGRAVLIPPPPLAPGAPGAPAYVCCPRAASLRSYQWAAVLLR